MTTERGTSAQALKLAVIDTDSGFLQVLDKRLERLGWEHRTLASAVPVDTIVAMRLSALVVDLAILGPAGWDYLERVASMLPVYLDRAVDATLPAEMKLTLTREGWLQPWARLRDNEADEQRGHPRPEPGDRQAVRDAAR